MKICLVMSHMVMPKSIGMNAMMNWNLARSALVGGWGTISRERRRSGLRRGGRL